MYLNECLQLACCGVNGPEDYNSSMYQVDVLQGAVNVTRHSLVDHSTHNHTYGTPASTMSITSTKGDTEGEESPGPIQAVDDAGSDTGEGEWFEEEFVEEVPAVPPCPVVPLTCCQLEKYSRWDRPSPTNREECCKPLADASYIHRTVLFLFKIYIYSMHRSCRRGFLAIDTVMARQGPDFEASNRMQEKF